MVPLWSWESGRGDQSLQPHRTCLLSSGFARVWAWSCLSSSLLPPKRCLRSLSSASLTFGWCKSECSEQHGSSQHSGIVWRGLWFLQRVVPPLPRESRESFCLLELIQRLGQSGGDGISTADFAARNLSGLARIASSEAEALCLQLPPSQADPTPGVKFENKATEKVAKG